MGDFNIKDTAIICYSHSSYNDVWDMFFGQLNKFLPNLKKYFFVDKPIENPPPNTNIIIYDDLPFSNKFLNCLNQVEEKFCIYHQEDMVLYDSPNLNHLNQLVTILNEYNIDYIKLLKGGHTNDIKLDNTPLDKLYYIPHTGLSYANQPTIWKTNALKQIFKNTSNTDIREFETKASNYLNTTNMVGMYWYNNEDKRGIFHYNSSVYPHGNFISKGKWVYSEYENELKTLHDQYKIDKSKRGIV